MAPPKAAPPSAHRPALRPRTHPRHPTLSLRPSPLPASAPPTDREKSVTQEALSLEGDDEVQIILSSTNTTRRGVSFADNEQKSAGTASAVKEVTQMGKQSALQSPPTRLPNWVLQPAPPRALAGSRPPVASPASAVTRGRAAAGMGLRSAVKSRLNKAADASAPPALITLVRLASNSRFSISSLPNSPLPDLNQLKPANPMAIAQQLQLYTKDRIPITKPFTLSPPPYTDADIPLPRPYNTSFPHPLTAYASPGVNPSTVSLSGYDVELQKLIERDSDTALGSILSSASKSFTSPPITSASASTPASTSTMVFTTTGDNEKITAPCLVMALHTFIGDGNGIPDHICVLFETVGGLSFPLTRHASLFPPTPARSRGSTHPPLDMPSISIRSPVSSFATSQGVHPPSSHDGFGHSGFLHRRPPSSQLQPHYLHQQHQIQYTHSSRPPSFPNTHGPPSTEPRSPASSPPQAPTLPPRLLRSLMEQECQDALERQIPAMRASQATSNIANSDISLPSHHPKTVDDLSGHLNDIFGHPRPSVQHHHRPQEQERYHQQNPYQYPHQHQHQYQRQHHHQHHSRLHGGSIPTSPLAPVTPAFSPIISTSPTTYTSASSRDISPMTSHQSQFGWGGDELPIPSEPTTRQDFIFPAPIPAVHEIDVEHEQEKNYEPAWLVDELHSGYTTPRNYSSTKSLSIIIPPHQHAYDRHPGSASASALSASTSNSISTHPATTTGSSSFSSTTTRWADYDGGRHNSIASTSGSSSMDSSSTTVDFSTGRSIWC